MREGCGDWAGRGNKSGFNAVGVSECNLWVVITWKKLVWPSHQAEDV